MNSISSLVNLGQSHHYYHHYSTLMVLLFYVCLVYFIDAALTFTFLYLLSCKAISHTRIIALVLFIIQTFSVRRVVSVVDRTWENIYPTFSSSLGLTLLLIEKATHDPLYLWDISIRANALTLGLKPFNRRPVGLVVTIRSLLI
jgi:hypothetical protein